MGGFFERLKGRAQLAFIVVIGLLMVAVDFTSKLASMAADGVLLVAMLLVIWPMLFQGKPADQSK